MERVRQPLGNLFFYNRRLLLAVLLSVIVTVLFAGAYSRVRNTQQYGDTGFSSIGSIQTIGVQIYGGNLTTTSNQTNQFLSWGAIYPGSQIARSFYIKSLSNFNVTLTLNTADWHPSDMSKYMNLNWNYTNTALKPSQIVYLRLTLSVSSSAVFVNYILDNRIQGFNFNINIQPK